MSFDQENAESSDEDFEFAMEDMKRIYSHWADKQLSETVRMIALISTDALAANVTLRATSSLTSN